MDEVPTVNDFRKSFTAKRKPSVKVGDQVRLTGVVESVSNGIVGIDLSEGNKCFLDANHIAALEVIRQPFKRGEVVYHIDAVESEPRTVVTDETEGFVLLARHVHGTEVMEWDATSFERRP